MTGIVRIAKDVTAFMHEILAKLLGARFCIVVGRTQRSQLIESRKCLATASFATVFRDWDAMVADFRRCNFANLQTGFAQRMRPQFKSA
jgi:hypothetical protein